MAPWRGNLPRPIPEIADTTCTFTITSAYQNIISLQISLYSFFPFLPNQNDTTNTYRELGFVCGSAAVVVKTPPHGPLIVILSSQDLFAKFERNSSYYLLLPGNIEILAFDVCSLCCHSHDLFAALHRTKRRNDIRSPVGQRCRLDSKVKSGPDGTSGYRMMGVQFDHIYHIIRKTI